MYKFIQLTNGKIVQAFYEADAAQIAKIIPASYDFKELTDGKISQKIAFVDSDGNKIEIFKVPFSTDLDTWHKTITENTFAESIAALPAKFLPRVAEFNSTDDQVLVTKNFSGTEITYLIRCKINAFTFSVNHLICGNNYTNRLVVNSSNNIIFYFDGTGASITPSLLNATINTYHTISIRVKNNGVDSDLRFGIDGVYDDVIKIGYNLSAFSSYRIGKWDVADFGIDGIINEVTVVDSWLTDSEIENNQPDYVLSGQGDYEYDISGNNNHGTWAGTGARFTYDLEGSLYPNSNGYSLWEHATLDPIQVPFDINGLALALTAGVDIPVGYTKTRDVVGGGNKWNMADALVDFDPDGNGDEILTGIVNGTSYPYETFNTSGNAISSAINTIGFGGCASNLIKNIIGGSNEAFTISFNITRVSGAYPTFKLADSQQGAAGTMSNKVTPTSDGLQTILLTSTNVTNKNAYLEIGVGDGVLTSFGITDISIKNSLSLPIDIFNRLNATRQTAASRAATNYDATNPYRYQVNEISDPRIYDTYFEAAYKDRIFGKVVLSGTDLIRYDEQLNYGTVKVGAELVTVEEYCGIDSIYPV